MGDKGKSLPLSIPEKLFRKKFHQKILSGDTLRAIALLAPVPPNKYKHSYSLLNNICGFYAAPRLPLAR